MMTSAATTPLGLERTTPGPRMPLPALKPPVRTESGRAGPQAGPPHPAAPSERETRRPAGVSGKGRITPQGYRPENADHIDALTEMVDGRRVGRDPMQMPVDALTAAGHRPRRSASIVAAMGDVPLVEGLRRHKDLRRQCLACAENSAEVRCCAIIDCPLWAYRMGRNPHNPRRGRNPFA